MVDKCCKYHPLCTHSLAGRPHPICPKHASDPMECACTDLERYGSSIKFTPRYVGEPLSTRFLKGINTIPFDLDGLQKAGDNLAKMRSRTPLSEYSDEELKLQLNLHGYVVLQEPEYNYFAKEATDHLRCGQKKVRWDKKCYKPCCAAKPEPIDWSDSWNEDIDDHPRR